MTAPVTITVRRTVYTVEAEPDHAGQPSLCLYNKLGGCAGSVLSDPASTKTPHAALVLCVPRWWTDAENRQAARDAIDAHNDSLNGATS
jgi:hypothetical protein